MSSRLGAGGLEVAQVTDVQQVEMAVGEGNLAPRRALPAQSRGECLPGQDLAHRISCRGRASERDRETAARRRVTVAVPIFITTTPPA